MLRLVNISKHFPGVKALSQVSLEFNAGEVHALCGENGAGKSTLMHLIAGNLQPDGGEIILNDAPVTFNGSADSREKGIGIVYQERSLSSELSVAENIYPGKHPRNKWGLINYPKLQRQTTDLLIQLRLTDISPKTIVSHLSPAQQQMVEIAKALAVLPKILILDEPTASITKTETDLLFEIIRQLTKKGVAVIYISHRMAEIRSIADKISVLKDGKLQGTMPPDTDDDTLIKMMVGRQLSKQTFESTVRGCVALDVNNISGNGFRHIDFKLHGGEILGLAGLIGSGRSELCKAIFGASHIVSGKLLMHGKLIKNQSPQMAVANRIAYLPEERKTFGLFHHLTLRENIISASLTNYVLNGLINSQKTIRTSEQFRKTLNIKSASVQDPIETLSGGNQQKTILARWLAIDPEVIIADEPTHGVDIGAKTEIYVLLKQMAASGKSILLISSELPELLLLCDRIAVMDKGEIKIILKKEEATEERLMHYASAV